MRTEPDEVGQVFGAHAYGGWSLANLFVPGMRVRPRGDVVFDLRTMDGSSPFGHVCSPDEVADAVRFLVGPQGVYLTAQSLRVDGGSF